MVPPLAERREDIPMLIEFFVAQLSEQAGIKPRTIGQDAMAVLQAHNWPGNVRQLRNNVERLLILARGDDATSEITASLLPTEVGDTLPRVPTQSDQHIMSLPLREAREVFEKEYLLAQISRFGGNISKTSDFVGMERSALHRKLKSLGV
jgi:two-component system nitrogen regulation response regulator NtrX